MRAVQIRTFGEPGIVLELADLPEPPAPTAGQVLIGVEHAPINMNDLYLIQGVYPVRPSLPSVVGNEGVGRVLAIGRGVDHLKVGDRVLVPLYSFSWRERLVAPAAGLSRRTAPARHARHQSTDGGSAAERVRRPSGPATGSRRMPPTRASAGVSRPSAVAGNGFEPATFGL